MITISRTYLGTALFRLMAAMLLVAMMPLLLGGDDLLAHDDDDCHDECDDSCQDCGSCAGCSRTVYMIPGAMFYLDSHFQAPAGAVVAHSLENECEMSDGIDHPPQNLL